MICDSTVFYTSVQFKGFFARTVSNNDSFKKLV